MDPGEAIRSQLCDGAYRFGEIRIAGYYPVSRPWRDLPNPGLWDGRAGGHRGAVPSPERGGQLIFPPLPILLFFFLFLSFLFFFFF
jgi:hypothetical protein